MCKSNCKHNEINGLSDVIASLRYAIAYSKRPGNEGQSLFNGKAYRPVSEVLTPAMQALESIETTLDALQKGVAITQSGEVNSFVQRVVNDAVESFHASLQPRYDNLNQAKAKAMRGAK